MIDNLCRAGCPHPAVEFSRFLWRLVGKPPYTNSVFATTGSLEGVTMQKRQEVANPKR